MDYDGMRAMTKEEMEKRAKRQYHAMQNAYGTEAFNARYYAASQNANPPSFFEMIERKPTLTMWQRFKSWIKE